MSIDAAMGSLYATNSSLQNSAIKQSRQYLLPHLNQQIQLMNHTNEPLTIADIGCSTGENSYEILEPLIQLAHSHGRTTTKYYCDLPSNNFSQLFQHLKQSDKNSHCYSVGVGRSFYEQLVPNESLDISWSASAYHWMNTDNISDKFLSAIKRTGVDHVTLHAIPSDLQQDLMRECVDKDWNQIVELRHRELKPGGIFVGLLMCAPSRRYKTSTTAIVKSALMELMESNQLLKSEWNRFYLPMYMRTGEQYLKGLESKFDIEYTHNLETPYSFTSLYEEGDLENWATAMTNFIKAFSENCFTSCLESTRTTEQVVQLTNNFYTIIQRQLLELDVESQQELALYKGNYVAVVARKKHKQQQLSVKTGRPFFSLKLLFGLVELTVSV
jgi:SAM-dependent methyltransferase